MHKYTNEKMPENVSVYSVLSHPHCRREGGARPVEESKAFKCIHFPIMLATVHTHAQENNCTALGYPTAGCRDERVAKEGKMFLFLIIQVSSCVLKNGLVF